MGCLPPCCLDVPGEGVAALEPPRVEAGLQPMRPLLRGAVSERLGVDPAVRLLLDAIVSDRGRGVQPLLEVAVLQDAAVIRGAAPNAGEAVGLQFEANGESVRVSRVVLALLTNPPLDAELLLDVVAELMREDVGLGEVARRLEAPVELVEEAEVDVDALVERAVERARLRARRATPGVRLAAEEDELRRLERFAGARELLLPEPLGVVEDERDELDLVVFVRALWHRVVARAALGNLWERAARSRDIEASASPALTGQEVDDDRDDHPDDPAATHATHRHGKSASAAKAAHPARLAAPVLDVAAGLPRPPLHRLDSIPAPRAIRWSSSPGCFAARGHR